MRLGSCKTGPLTHGHHGGVGEPGVFLRHGFPISSQTLLDLLREKAQEVAQGPLLKDRDPPKAPPKSTLGSQDSALQDLQRLRNIKKMHNSSCFGQKIDRIGSISRLGCNGELVPCRFTASCTPALPPSTCIPPLEVSRFAIWSPCTALHFADHFQNQGSLSGNVTWEFHNVLTGDHLPSQGSDAPQGADCLLVDHPFTGQKEF